MPDRPWHVLGPVSGFGETPDNLHLHGWVPDVEARVARAALLVGGGGDGVVALAAAQGKRFLCLPEERAYGEQTEKAAALARLGAAIVHQGWPAAAAWPGLIRAGLALDPASDRPPAQTGRGARTARPTIEALIRAFEADMRKGARRGDGRPDRLSAGRGVEPQEIRSSFAASIPSARIASGRAEKSRYPASRAMASRAVCSSVGRAGPEHGAALRLLDLKDAHRFLPGRVEDQSIVNVRYTGLVAGRAV